MTDWEFDSIVKHTMNVQQLIDILQKYPPKMKMIVTWEHQLDALNKKNIYVSKEGHLYLDGDNNRYKKEFAKDVKENEEQ